MKNFFENEINIDINKNKKSLDDIPQIRPIFDMLDDIIRQCGLNLDYNEIKLCDNCGQYVQNEIELNKITEKFNNAIVYLPLSNFLNYSVLIACYRDRMLCWDKKNDYLKNKIYEMIVNIKHEEE